MIACIVIPHFATTIHGDSPLILLDGDNRVYACCSLTHAAGVRAGMRGGQALSLCPDARIETATPHHDWRVEAEVLERLSIYARRLEALKHTDGQTVMILLDLGVLRPSDGRQIGGQMLTLIDRYFGFIAQVGLAGDRFTAQVVADRASTGAVDLITPADTRDYLAPLPLNTLPLTKDMAHRLPLLGIHTVGQFASLPRSAVFDQFGRMGRFAHKLAWGEDTRRIARYVPERRERVERCFDGAISNRLHIDATLCDLSTDLVARLDHAGMTTREIALTMWLDDGTVLDEAMRVADPIHTTARLYLSLLRLFAKLSVHCGVTGVAVELRALAPLIPVQMSLFDPPARDLDAVLVDLAFRYGADCFFRPSHESDSPLPERRFRLDSVG